MWDEENDKKLKEAAENFQPAPDESAWQKMEQLLDENLPQQKDRKRILFFLPALLILGGLLFFVFFYHRGNYHFKQPTAAPATSANEHPAKVNPAEKSITTSPVLTPGIGEGNERTTAENGAMTQQTAVRHRNDFVNTQSENKDADQFVSKQKVENDEMNTENIESSRAKNLSNSYSENKDEKEVNQPRAEENQNEDKSILPATTANHSQNPAGKTSKEKTKKRNGFADNFSLGFSAGPGISAVGSKQGKLTLDLGVVAAYRFSNHFGVRSGVFISKKIYSATPSDYTVPGGGSYNYLEKINANCNVIDIPLNIDYYFGKKRNHGWFVSAGLSSYLMKKESYDYVYKTPAGQVYTKNRTISNQNKHFFSVVDLSLGYEYLINDKFSLAAQPHIDLPLTGIGAGKVKLFSEGILFTIKVKPFRKEGK